MKKIITIYTWIAATAILVYSGYYGWKLYQQAMGNIPVHTTANGGMITYYSHSSIFLTIVVLLCLTLLPRYIVKKLIQEIHRTNNFKK